MPRIGRRGAVLVHAPKSDGDAGLPRVCAVRVGVLKTVNRKGFVSFEQTMSEELDRLSDELEKTRRIFEMTIMLRAFTMSGKIDRLEAELEKIRRECDDLRADNLRKDETIQRLTAELKASSPRKYVYDAVLGEGGPKIYRWEMDPESLKKRRAEALERKRIEYENRVGISNQNETNQSDDGYDEIDESKPKN